MGLCGPGSWYLPALCSKEAGSLGLNLIQIVQCPAAQETVLKQEPQESKDPSLARGRAYVNRVEQGVVGRVFWFVLNQDLCRELGVDVPSRSDKNEAA